MIEFLTELQTPDISADVRHLAAAEPASLSFMQPPQAVVFDRPALARRDDAGAVQLWGGRARIEPTNQFSLSRIGYPRGEAEVELAFEGPDGALALRCDVTTSRGRHINGSEVSTLADMERLVRERFRTDPAAEVRVIGAHVVVRSAAKRESTARLGMDSGYVWTREARVFEVEDGAVYTYRKSCTARSLTPASGRVELDAAWESLGLTVG